MRIPGAILAMMALAILPLPGAEKQQVGIEQIGKEVAIIGRLGAPLGKIVSVTATYDPKARGPSAQWGRNEVHMIRVIKVNGQDLPSPVEIHLEFASASGGLQQFPVDRPFECKGRELGGFDDFFQLFEDSTVQESGAFGFYTSFSVVEEWATDEAKPVKNLKQIKVEEIGKNIDLVGRLGIPIGKGITVTAIFDPEHQPPVEKKGTFGGGLDQILRITRINGADLPLPVVILAMHSPGARSPQTFPVNTPFECRGCEFYLTRREEFCGEYEQVGREAHGPGSVFFLSNHSEK
jgi:hypothetical protein